MNNIYRSHKNKKGNKKEGCSAKGSFAAARAHFRLNIASQVYSNVDALMVYMLLYICVPMVTNKAHPMSTAQQLTYIYKFKCTTSLLHRAS